MGVNASSVLPSELIGRFPVLQGLRLPSHASHRGGGATWGPENTLHTYRRSVNEARTEILEIDLHLSADDVIVLHHDARIAPRGNFPGGYISDLTLAQLRAIDIAHDYTTDALTYPLRGQGHTIPTLNEVLDEFLPHPTLVFFFDMKAPEAVEPAMRVIQERGMKHRVIFGAVFREINMAIQRLRPPDVPLAADAKTMLSVLSSYAIGRLNVADYPQEILGFYLDHRTMKVLTKRLFDEIHRQGKLIAVFGPLTNDRATWATMHEWRTDIIMCDRPDVGREETDRLGLYEAIKDAVDTIKTEAVEAAKEVAAGI
eukprot:TRINITY_DN3411_c0_g1_i3.p1 TRINITY_DN3411_c0_g1~~TRINITY_DN3411_c0_g1_i3.p1  ORF type:complete len:314 (-),score=67.96 TRINITY_DN3411_c0_g1_i3:4-945(-)